MKSKRRELEHDLAHVTRLENAGNVQKTTNVKLTKIFTPDFLYPLPRSSSC